MAYRSGVVAPVEGGGACEEQRIHVVGVDGERAQYDFFRLSLQRPTLGHREGVRVIREELRIARQARGGLGVGFASLVEAPQNRVRAREHRPALAIVGVVLHARRQTRDQRFELLRAQTVGTSALRGLRQEGPGVADRQVDGERANRQRQTQSKGGGARARRRLRRGVALVHVGQQPRLDLAARFFMLVHGQRSGAQVELELAQLITVYREVDGIARRAWAQAAGQQRRPDEQQRGGDEHRADQYERNHGRSASLPARSSAARLRSEAVISGSCAGRRRKMRRRRTTNPAASSSSGPNHKSTVVSLNGGRYRTKAP